MADSPAQLIDLSAEALAAQHWARAGALAQSARTVAEQSNDVPLAERASGFEELSRIGPGLNVLYVGLISRQLRGDYAGESLKQLVRKDPGGATLLEARLNDAPTLKKKFGIELSTEHQETARSGGTSAAAAGFGGVVVFIFIARVVLRLMGETSQSYSHESFDRQRNIEERQALIEQALKMQDDWEQATTRPRKVVAPRTNTLWHFPKKHDVPDAWNLVDDVSRLRAAWCSVCSSSSPETNGRGRW